MRPNRLDSVDPVKLAWLLRADLRRGLPAGAPIPEWFQMWWVIEGTREYPAWADRTPASAQHLFYPSPDWPSYGVLGVTPAMLYLRERRKDLQDGFDLNTQRGQWELIAWFYSHGVREYKLGQRLGQDILDALDDTPPFLQNAEDTAPPLTWLMYFTWFGSAELQEAFDLRTLKGKQDFLQWYLFDGVPNFRHAALISRRWKQWLDEPIQLDGFPMPLTRAALLLWHRQGELNHRFDIFKVEEAERLKIWLADSSQDERVWWTTIQGSRPNVVIARPFGVNLIGFAFGELGIGEDVRMAAEACEAAGIPYSVINIHPGEHLRQNDRTLSKKIGLASGSDEAPYRINLFCLTGFDTARVALEKGPKLFDGRHNIGWWPWELPVWPQDWKAVFSTIDEIWAATNFTYRMYLSTASKIEQSAPKVIHMPMPASVRQLAPMSRAQLQLPQSRFLYLYIFDFNSYIERKNPFAAIQAFKRAFRRNDKSVGLVIKTMNSDKKNKVWKRFITECGKDDRIHLIERTMQRGEVLALIDACDAYVSLHRSEGLGRTMAEAMLLGKPIICTDFSGNTDFVNCNTGFPVKWRPRLVRNNEYPFITTRDSAWWAEPQIPDASNQLIRARRCASEKLEKIQKIGEQKFDPQIIGKLILNRISTQS